MKKILALCTAILLSAAFTGCGKSSEDKPSSVPTNNLSKRSDTKKSDKEEKNVVDPFDKVDYYVPEYRYTNDDKENIYPNDFIIELDASESPFGDHMKFTYFIESADEKEIIIKARANIDEIQDFLDEYNYAVEETEKTFSIKTTDLKTQLISADLITNDNKTKIIEKMKEGIKFDEAIGDEISEYTLEKLYVIVPDEPQFEFKNRKEDSIIQKDKDSFEDRYLNTASFSVLSTYEKRILSTVFGIFKNKEGNYYCVYYNSGKSGLGILFDKGIIDEDSLECIMVNNIIDGDSFGDIQVHNYFPDEKSAYDKIVSSYDSVENYAVVEIPVE